MWHHDTCDFTYLDIVTWTHPHEKTHNNIHTPLLLEWGQHGPTSSLHITDFHQCKCLFFMVNFSLHSFPGVCSHCLWTSGKNIQGDQSVYALWFADNNTSEWQQLSSKIYDVLWGIMDVLKEMPPISQNPLTTNFVFNSVFQSRLLKYCLSSQIMNHK